MVHKQDYLFINRDIQFVVLVSIAVVDNKHFEVVIFTDSQVLIVIFTIELDIELDTVIDKLQ